VSRRTEPPLDQVQHSYRLSSAATIGRHLIVHGGIIMNRTLALTTLALCGLLGSAAVLSEDSDADRSHPGAFVKDSAITTKIKSKLAAEHITSMGRIHVDTDKEGVVWLSGTARSQEAIDKAESIAKNTEHVRSVHNDIKIKADD
jgi:hyperosmotically inducible protein